MVIVSGQRIFSCRKLFYHRYCGSFSSLILFCYYGIPAYIPGSLILPPLASHNRSRKLSILFVNENRILLCHISFQNQPGSKGIHMFGQETFQRTGSIGRLISLFNDIFLGSWSQGNLKLSVFQTFIDICQ